MAQLKHAQDMAPDDLTGAIARAIASSRAFSVADGGAFLEFLEGKKLPAVSVLEGRTLDALAAPG